MVGANLTTLFSTLITASHILHYNGVLDAYGHLSVRNPNNASTFFMSRNEAPALMASSSDIVEYLVSDASPVDANAPKGFIERYIHSEIFKRFSNISSVVHSHSPEVIPFSMSGVPFRAAIHLAGFIGDFRRLLLYFDSKTLMLGLKQAPKSPFITSRITTTQLNHRISSSATSLLEPHWPQSSPKVRTQPQPQNPTTPSSS